MNSAILSYTASKHDAGKTVETICRKKLDISAGLLTELKLENKLYLNNNPCRSIDIVRENDVLTADVTENICSELIEPVYIPINIIYEDAFLTVVNKPRKMCVHQSPGNYGNTLANSLVYHWQQQGEMHRFHAVNRLDKDTSGICVIAKNRFTHGALKDFKKKYLAIVHGSPVNKSGIINMPIKRSEDSVIKRITASDGKAAITHYKILKEQSNMSLVEIELETGRTHQIRVHFSHIGHPLVGDWLYGTGDKERSIATGHLLHAYDVSFTHPATGEHLHFTADMPEDMKRLFHD